MKIVIPNIKLIFNHTDEAMKKEVCSKLRISENQLNEIIVKKRSVDARKKPSVFFVYTLIVDVKTNVSDEVLKKTNGSLFSDKKYEIPVSENIKDLHSPIVIGAGPAGLFCGLILAKAGLKPIILERGEDAYTRAQTVKEFIKTGELALNSNITFGEGGAGTFSDGKLNTGVKDKFLRKEFILNTLVEHGADPSILYMANPHVGTDYLVDVVSKIRKEIIDLGGQVRFNSLVTSIEKEKDDILRVTVNHEDTEVDLTSNRVVLAVGHSARDTFKMLHEKSVEMESKPFAIGLRIEHPQQWINRSQYGDVYYDNLKLPTAEYKLTHQTKDGRGVYSFCMCPGGFVVNASSHEGMCVCNGMSLFARDNTNANAAIIVTVKPEDFSSKNPLAGIEFQEKWERKVYDVGSNYDLVTEEYSEFYKSVTGKELPFKSYMKDSFYQVKEVKSTCESPLTTYHLKECLPKYVSESIVDGIEAFGRKIRGYDHPKARLIGVETRTSSPVRIVRDKEMSSNMKGLYPCGEGAGYAGGIMSAAIDGMKVAEQVIRG